MAHKFIPSYLIDIVHAEVLVQELLRRLNIPCGCRRRRGDERGGVRRRIRHPLTAGGQCRILAGRG